MPRPRRRRKTPRERHPRGADANLLFGKDFFGDAWGQPPYDEETLNEMEVCWFERRERLLELWAAVPNRSHDFPWAYHAFESTPLLDCGHS